MGIKKKAALKSKPGATGLQVVVKALRAAQGKGINVFSFFLPGAEITRIADMLPVERDSVDAGVLKIPIRPEGERVAWVVDGQRALALGAGDARTLPIPVVGFISDDIEIQRVPRDVPARKIPSELCSLLNRDPKSPFHKLIGRASVTASAGAVVADTAIVATIRNSINNPFGALAPFRAAGHSPVDMQSMYEALTTYWSAVREVFKQAWGLPPGESRLMHSAGIQAMGVLMDCIYLRHAGKGNEYQAIRDDLEKMRPAGR